MFWHYHQVDSTRPCFQWQYVLALPSSGQHKTMLSMTICSGITIKWTAQDHAFNDNMFWHYHQADSTRPCFQWQHVLALPSSGQHKTMLSMTICSGITIKRTAQDHAFNDNMFWHYHQVDSTRPCFQWQHVLALPSSGQHKTMLSMTICLTIFACVSVCAGVCVCMCVCVIACVRAWVCACEHRNTIMENYWYKMLSLLALIIPWITWTCSYIEYHELVHTLSNMNLFIHWVTWTCSYLE